MVMLCQSAPSYPAHPPYTCVSSLLTSLSGTCLGLGCLNPLPGLQSLPDSLCAPARLSSAILWSDFLVLTPPLPDVAVLFPCLIPFT